MYHKPHIFKVKILWVNIWGTRTTIKIMSIAITSQRSPCCFVLHSPSLLISLTTDKVKHLYMLIGYLGFFFYDEPIQVSYSFFYWVFELFMMNFTVLCVFSILGFCWLYVLQISFPFLLLAFLPFKWFPNFNVVEVHPFPLWLVVFCLI